MNDLNKLRENALLWARLRYEQDGRAMRDCNSMSATELKAYINELQLTEKPSADEPNDLDGILALCDMPKPLGSPDNIEDRIFGAVAGRFAGCTLGVPVEGYSLECMENVAKDGGTPFPPTEYWHTVLKPDGIQYGVDKRLCYTQDGIKYVPVDDDITYPVLDMLLLEKYGADYTVEDLADMWMDILPYACTAEDAAIGLLRNGVPAVHAADFNPYVEWIGAAIRADAFAYVCAGDPAAAAKLCYNDAYLTHRRNGLYGGMYTAALISAAFCVPPLQAVDIAKNCIPGNSRLRKDIDWALSCEDRVKDYRSARALLDERFVGMNSVHIENNVCAVIFALMLGGDDYTWAIANSVAIGLDNDCNAATVGSVMGAYLGINGIDDKWYKPFNNRVKTYLTGHEEIALDRVVESFVDMYKRNKKNTEV